MVRGTDTQPAKFSIIAERVWLLEKTDARCRFLVFGNNRKVPTQWLKKYGHLAREVAFLFLADDGQLEVLSDSGEAFSNYLQAAVSQSFSKWPQLYTARCCAFPCDLSCETRL
jgi:hypothetical protein